MQSNKVVTTDDCQGSGRAQRKASGQSLLTTAGAVVSAAAATYFCPHARRKASRWALGASAAATAMSHCHSGSRLPPWQHTLSCLQGESHGFITSTSWIWDSSCTESRERGLVRH